MSIFIECWKARPEWPAFYKESRAEYLAELGKGIEQLKKAGSEIVSWSMNDPCTANRAR